MKYFVLSFLAITLAFSCSSDFETDDQSKSLEISSFDDLGVLHNEALRNVAINFESEDYSDELSLEERYRVVSDFNSKFVMEHPFTNLNKEEIVSNMRSLEELVNTEINYSILNGTSSIDKIEIYASLELLENQKIIDEFEYLLISELIELSISNYSKEISNVELSDQIDQAIVRWNLRGYSSESQAGVVSAIILNISKHSVEYWTEDAPDNLKVLPWVAADVGGAIYGAVAGAVGSKVTTGKVSGKAAGWGAVAGAIGGSTGIAGKIGKFLFR